MALFGLGNVKTALKVHAEYVKKGAARIPGTTTPATRILEIDRESQNIDSLWHMPLAERTLFRREFDLPCIVRKERPDWRLTRIGLVPQQKHKFWMANLLLQEVDWFPQRGDLIAYDGYRHLITKVVIEPECFWGQTGVWLGLIVETTIPPEGDARPLPNLGLAAPSEHSPGVPPKVVILPEI